MSKEKRIMDVMFLDQSGNTVDTVKMPSIPRVGESINIVGVIQYSHPFKVLKVEYEFQGEKENLKYMWAYVTVEECLGGQQ